MAPWSLRRLGLQLLCRARRAARGVSADGMLVLGVAAAGVIVLIEAATSTTLRDAETALACRYPPASGVLTAAHVRELEAGNLVVIRNVLPTGVLCAARADAAGLVRAGALSADNHGNAGDVRQDRICWVRDDAAAPALGDGLSHCVRLLRGLPFLLERHGYGGAHSFAVPRQCQLACYSPEGSAGYVRHLDRCALSILDMGLLNWVRASDYRGRAVTAILYLNDPEWASGGALRCFDAPPHPSQQMPGGHGVGGGGSASFRDVSPAGGTLVLFDASRVEHQVLPSSADRYALTCWISGELTA